MRVQFTFDLENMAEVVYKGWSHNPQVRRRRWINLVVVPAVCGIVALIVVSGPMERRVISAAAAVLGATLFSWLTYKRTEMMRIRRWLRGSMEPDKEYLCVVELTPDHVICTQFETEIRFPWHKVTAIVEQEDGVDIETKINDGVNVRKRAFSSTEEQQRFVELAKSYMDRSKQRANNA